MNQSQKTNLQLRPRAVILLALTALVWAGIGFARAEEHVAAIESLARIKREWRARRFGNLWSEPLRHDLARDLVDRLEHSSLESMSRAGLLSARLEKRPWSDSYWPIYQGVLANRYADPGFPGVRDWKRNTDYVLNSLGNAGSVDRLSPAEKYDLLVGDSEFTLTRTMINEGRRYYESDGRVEAWMGICHGWAPASYMLERPENAVRVLAADGRTEILFYPSDIKALATLLWANAQVPTRFVGGRCNTKNPSEDRMGRPNEQECLDNNPGTWHLSVVNQIGVSKRSFVVDVTYDYEVWNQPVAGYSYTYFNPKTGRQTSSLSEATVQVADFREDRFRSVRSPKARSIVGVKMTMTYMVETSPTVSMFDSPDDDSAHSMTLRYDLELDEDGTIVGGEWYDSNHPDFLWTPGPDARARSIGDIYLDRDRRAGDWDRKGSIPADWRPYAIQASRYGQPLARIVDALISLSRLGIAQ